MTTPADLSVAIRNAIVADATVTGKLTAYAGSWPVFTRRPVPTDAAYPIIIISTDIASSNEDGISDSRPVITRDVTVYGQNDTSAKYRDVEIIAFRLNEIFHRKRLSITVPGWHVVGVTVDGPTPAPTDDDATVARVVTLNFRLAVLTQ